MMVFAAEFFSHAISTTLGVRRLRGADARAPRPAATLARSPAPACSPASRSRFEYQTGLVGAVLFFYALARAALGPARRGLRRRGGGGALPILAFNAWTLGSPLQARLQPRGRRGRASAGTPRSGLNSDGFFGITLPRWDAVRDLLFAGRGLLVLTPVLVMAVVGVVLMRRRGHRAEAWTIAAVAIAYFVYNIGYWQPYGGGTPGPRFLIPALPFVALGLAFAYRRFPATTLALAVPSAIWMVAAASPTRCSASRGPTSGSPTSAAGSSSTRCSPCSACTRTGSPSLPVLLAIGAAIAFAAAGDPAHRAPRTPGTRATRSARSAPGSWSRSSARPSAAIPVTPLDGGGNSFVLIAIGAAGGARRPASALRSARSRPEEATGSPLSRLALGDRTS